MAYLYRHIRHDKDEPFYIGIAIGNKDGGNPYKRAFEKARRNNIWKRITDKTEYSVEILFDDISVEFAKQKEIEFIKLYGRIDLKTGTLSNLTDGGDGTVNKVYTDDYRLKLSESQKGKIVSEETRKKISANKKNKKLSESHKNNVIKAIQRRGHKVSENGKKSISIKNSGSSNGMYGVYGEKHPNFKGYIIVYQGDKLIGSYEGIYKCSEELGVSASKISACLSGRRLTTGGYKFVRRK